MKIIPFAIAALIAASTFADATGSRPMTKEESLAAMQKMSAKDREALVAKRKAEAEMRVGGYIELPATGNVIRVVNKQRLVPEEAVLKSAKEMCNIIGMTMDVANEDGEGKKIAARIELFEDPSAPTLLIAPEDRFGKLNVSRLATDSPNDELLRQRFVKEFWRVTGMTLGAFNSNVSPCVMRNIYSLSDLDKDPALSPSPEVFDKIQGTCRHLGILRPRRISYRRACIEGIAPAPTNEVQKAIWDKVHTMPTEPLKIKPEEKKTEK